MGTLTTTDGRITVWTPDDPAWVPDVEGVGAFTQVKARRIGPGAFCFLTAKFYTVGPADVTTADALLREIYPAIYAKKFQSVKLDSMGEVTGGDGERWTQAYYELVHANVGSIIKIERARVVGRDIMVTSGEGIPDDMNRFADTVFAWMDHARFGEHSLARAIGDPILASLGIQPKKP